jgi:hypothetical protein
MNQDNYSHILNIKILSKSSGTIVNDIHLSEMIKGLFLQNEQTFNGIKLIWRKIEWKDSNKHFDIGDLVIDSAFDVDDVLLQCVEASLTDINKELHDKGLMFKGQEIIFKIVKPMVERISLIDTIGIIV